VPKIPRKNCATTCTAGRCFARGAVQQKMCCVCWARCRRGKCGSGARWYLIRAKAARHPTALAAAVVDTHGTIELRPGRSHSKKFFWRLQPADNHLPGVEAFHAYIRIIAGVNSLNTSLPVAYLVAFAIMESPPGTSTRTGTARRTTARMERLC